MSRAKPSAHVIVLAAGRGSRLDSLGASTPKWLLDVGGQTIADRQLEGIRLAGDCVDGVHVVVGHAAEAIAGAMARRRAPVALIDNPEYAELNNWWSLLRGLDQVPEEATVVVINADLVAAPEHVAAFIRASVAPGADALLAVDFERALTDESMKVSRDEHGLLEQIGKVGVPEAVGEYIGMLAARGEARERLRAELASFVGRPECANEWYEGAVGRTAAAGTPWQLWPIPTSGWVEVDDHADLDLALALVAGS